MGRDKAFVEVQGVPMVRRVAAALSAAGSDRVITVGGDRGSLEAIGALVVDDLYPGDGPLGGVITALRATTSEVLVVVACDMPWVEAAHFRRLVHALADADVDVAVSTAEGALQPLHAAWRVASVDALQKLFDDGERAPRRAIPALRCIEVELGDGPWSTDVDTPGALDSLG